MPEFIGDNTRRDFQSQYIELLDMAKKLSSSYDPSVSSESDPIVVLIKQMAMLGDKLEYNKDKAIREAFPSTVQQRSNAQEMYDCLGYRVKGWRSATGYVFLSVKNTEGLGTSPITIPRFTRIVDANNLFNYVTTNSVTFDTTNPESWQTPQKVGVIEGEIKTLEVGGIQEIGIANMDENYRIYFPEQNVAENGIFISITGTTGMDFVRVDNPYMLQEGNIYAVGEGDNGEIYVQFPDTIVGLLGTENTLLIKYVTSKGADGMCKAKTLYTVADEIQSDSSEEVSVKDKIYVSQPSATVYGENPESIESAYRNFKKTQGVFNTLITEKDYESYAYESEYNNAPLYGNVVVSSRTTDLNQTVKIKTLKNWAHRDIYRLIGENATPYDVWVYGTNPTGDYDNRFRPDVGNQIDILNEQIQNIKAVQQTVQNPNGSLRFYWNEYNLVGTILLKSKVNLTEKSEIENNVWTALQQYLSARNVEFGNSIDYEGAISAIQNADNRIVTVVLNLPRYQIKSVIAGQGGAEVKYLGDSEKTTLIAKMVLAGNVQLYKFDERFNIDFGTVVEPIKDVSTTEKLNAPIDKVETIATGVVSGINGVDELTSELLINPNISSTIVDGKEQERTIGKNEVLTLVGEKYKTSVEYSTYVKVKYYSTTATQSIAEDTSVIADSTIIQNSNIKTGSTLVVNAVNNGISVSVPIASNIVLTTGSVIKAGSMLAAGSMINGVGTSGDVEEDITINQNSTIVSGSALFDDTSIILAEDYVVYGSIAIGIGSELKSGTQIAYGSTLNGKAWRQYIPKNQNYKLAGSERIDVEYQDASGLITSQTYGGGTVIETNVDIGGNPVSNIDNPNDTIINSNDAVTIQTGGYLRIKDAAISKISKGTFCYLIGGPALVIPASGSYRLSDSEYFVYTSSTRDEMVILNPGTLLKNTSTEQSINIPFNSVANGINEITESDIDNIDWVSLPQTIEAYDQEVITFGEGAKVLFGNNVLSRDFQPLTNKIIISEGTSTVEYYTNLSSEGEPVPYQARYTLNVAMTKTQQLGKGQFVWINFTIGEDGIPVGNSGIVIMPEGDNSITIEASEPLVMSGGEIWSGISNASDIGMIAYSKTKNPVDLKINDLDVDSQQLPQRTSENEGGYIEISTQSDTPVKINATLNYVFNKITMIPIVVSTVGDATWTIAGGEGETLYCTRFKATTDEESMKTVAMPSPIMEDGKLLAGQYVLYIDPNNTPIENIIIEGTQIGQASSVQIGKPFVVDGINTEEINVTNSDCVPGIESEQIGFVARDVYVLSDQPSEGEEMTNADALILKISELDPDAMFDYTYQVNEDEKVVKPTLSENYFNQNHWANKYVIPKMDLDASKKRLIINPGQITR